MRGVCASRTVLAGGVLGVVMLALVVLVRSCCCASIDADQMMSSSHSAISQRSPVAAVASPTASPQRHDVATAAPVAQCTDLITLDMAAPPVAPHDGATMMPVAFVMPAVGATAHAMWSPWSGQRRGPPHSGVQQLRLKCVLQV